MKKFISIIAFLCLALSWAKAENTDISALDNTIYIENFTAKAGDQVTLSVKMKNTFQPTGFQFDLVLPEGFSVAEDEDGFMLIELSTERTTAKKTDTFSSETRKDGSIRTICSSTKNYTFSGNDGEVATIVVNIDKTVAAGSYPIILKTVELSEANGTAHPVSGTIESTATITQTTTQKGDVNEDGVVDISDVNAVISIICGK